MSVQAPLRVPSPASVGPDRRVLFVVSRELPERYDSLAYAFDGDPDVKVIFDRRRGERRQRRIAPAVERRRQERRSTARDWRLRSVGWVRIDGAG